eukprot:85996_1
MALSRLTKELRDLEEGLQRAEDGSKTVFIVSVHGDDLFKWDAIITGVEGTPYEGGQYLLSITFPMDYPLKPPTIKFDTKIYHGSISEYGAIDCDILKDNWSPVLTVAKILHTLRSCMSSGGNLTCLYRSDIAQEMSTNMITFVKKVVNHNQTHAGGPQRDLDYLCDDYMTHITQCYITTHSNHTINQFPKSLATLIREYCGGGMYYPFQNYDPWIAFCNGNMPIISARAPTKPKQSAEQQLLYAALQQEDEDIDDEMLLALQMSMDDTTETHPDLLRAIEMSMYANDAKQSIASQPFSYT